VQVCDFIPVRPSCCQTQAHVEDQRPAQDFGSVIAADDIDLSVAPGEGSALLVECAGKDNALQPDCRRACTRCRRNPTERPQYYRGQAAPALHRRNRTAHIRSLGRSRILTVFEKSAWLPRCMAGFGGSARRRPCAEILERLHLLRRANTLAGALTLLERKRWRWRARSQPTPFVAARRNRRGTNRGGVSRTDRDIKQVHAAE